MSAALGCQDPPPAKPQTEATASANSGPVAPPPALECVADPLAEELTSFCAFDLAVPPIPLAKMEWNAEPYHPPTPIITLDLDGLHDPEGEDTTTIQAWLADPPRRIGEPGLMVLAIAADVPATSVAELQRGLAAAHRVEVRYLVHVDDEAAFPLPRMPEMLANMAQKLPEDSHKRMMFIVESMRGYAESCPALADVFSSLATVAPENACQTLAQGAAEAIVGCGCTDLPEVMTMLYALTIGFDPPVGRTTAVPVMLDPNHKVAPEPGATWGELASAQFKDTQLHHLWIDAVAPIPDPGPDRGPDPATP